MLILILATNIFDCRDIMIIRQDMDKLLCAGNWNVDIGDVDKVLRILIATWDKALPVFFLLGKYHFDYRILNMYNTDLGIDYPYL